MQKNLFNNETAPTVRHIDYERDLNASQFEAVSVLDGPVLVIAGAGTGKTRTLVYRVARLVELGIPPENILLLTFTRKASQEMLYRASLLLDDSCSRVMGGTFHSAANMLLRRYGRHLGFAPNFTILDRPDAEGIIKLLKSSLNLEGVDKKFPSKNIILNIFSRAVNKSESLEASVALHYEHLLPFLEDFIRIEEDYRKFKLEHGLMDYDDLLVHWRQVLFEFPEVRAEIASRFSYILVDEYQDTNLIQADIIRQMAHAHDNVMAVGDDAQSIYSFRGADFHNIMNFPNLFPGARIVKLEENYRSIAPILDLTNAIIAQAVERYTKNLYSRIQGDKKPVLFGARNEAEQARFIADAVMKLEKEAVPLSEIAVLFRSGFHSYQLELELNKRHINFEKRGGLKLTESAHTKDLLAYLRVIANPRDFMSWNRLLLQLPKIGPKSARKIIEGIKEEPDPIASLQKYAASDGRTALKDLAELLCRLQQPGLSPAAMFEIAMSYYNDIFERVYHDDYPRRRPDLEQIREIIGGYDLLQAFIDDTALDPPDFTGDKVAYASGKSEARLVLSTIHSAKGLEWHTVFVIHLAEGRFPAARYLAPEQLEEERRLLYVAATRARQNLFLTYPMEFTVEGQFRQGAMSSLLSGLPAGFTEGSGRGRGTGDPSGPRVLPSLIRRAPAEPGEFPAGTRVRHDFFGEGLVERVIDARTVEVYFIRHGKKVLRLDYAKLETMKKG